MIPTFRMFPIPDDPMILQRFAGSFTLAELAQRVGRPLGEVVARILSAAGTARMSHSTLSEALAGQADAEPVVHAKRKVKRKASKRSTRLPEPAFDAGALPRKRAKVGSKIHRQKLDAAVLAVLGESPGWIRPVLLRQRNEIRTWLRDPTQSYEISDSLRRLQKAGHNIKFAGSTSNRIVQLA